MKMAEGNKAGWDDIGKELNQARGGTTPTAEQVKVSDEVAAGDKGAHKAALAAATEGATTENVTSDSE